MDYQIVLPSALKTVSEEGNKGVYEVDGLYPGYGHTLGNSWRRILLSSLEGAAVTRAKIESASHEFATLPGVLEDVITILLNVKQLRFKLSGESPQIATISVKGVKEIKGRDIKCPTQLEVINKDQHIATVTEKSTAFNAELTVETGIGFVPAEELEKDKVAVGTLMVDAIFTPIKRVNYEVENMRVGDRTDFNRLRVFIETDGTISPKDAIKKSLYIMKKQIESIEPSAIEEEIPIKKQVPISPEPAEGLDLLKLTPKVKAALVGAGIKTPQELSMKAEAELKELSGVGDKSISDMKKSLAKLGLSLNG